MKKRKVIKTLLVIITVLIIAAGFALFSLISGEKVKYIGYSQSKDVGSVNRKIRQDLYRP